jgi:hypothetical protein
VIIHDFNIPGVPVAPFKTDSPLIVNANTVLPGAVAGGRGAGAGGAGETDSTVAHAHSDRGATRGFASG